MAKGSTAGFNSDKYFYDVWFPKKTTEITIVAPPSYDDLEDAELESLDYAFFDSIGDRDTVYAIGKLLSKQYPQAVIKLTCSKDFNKNYSFDSNFVVIGGPGGKVYNEELKDWDMLYGNEVCQVFSERIKSKVSYSEDCETMLCEGQQYRASYNKKGHTTSDYGYFAAFQNPYLKSRRVVLLHGLHTLGVLGASRLFHSDVDACDNLEFLANLLAKSDSTEVSFETFFKVLVSTGQVECPEMHAEQIFIIRRDTTRALTETGSLESNGEYLQISDNQAKQLKEWILTDITRRN